MSTEDRSPAAPGVAGATFSEFTGEKMRPLTEEQISELETKEEQEMQRRLAAMKIKHQHEYKPAIAGGDKSAKLYTGAEIPFVGLGTWQAGKGEAGAAIESAIKAGYRHIDTAAAYENESDIGEALIKVLDEGVVSREDLWITTKLWNTEHSTAAVRAACIHSLKALRTPYVDLYLIHWPCTGSVGEELVPAIKETWQAMEGLVEEGLVKHIGVSNFSIKKIKDVLSYAKIKPAVNQVEAHPYFRNDELLKFCQEQGIHMTAYSPLGASGQGFLNYSVSRRRYNLLSAPVVQELAAKYGKDAGQIVLRWAVQRGTSVLPKSTKPHRIASNADLFGWALEPADFQALNRFEVQLRMVDGKMFLHPRGPYKKLSDLWDDPEDDVRIQKAMIKLYDMKTAEQVPCAQLATGASIPLLGLGTWKSEPGQVHDAVVLAVQAGYRHIDCAEVYANEHEVGEALEQIFDEGVVSRSDLFIVSKLWNSDHAPDRVPKALEKTLKALKVDYLDAYLMHWPASGLPGPEIKPALSDTWAAMEGLVDRGLVKAIGISNFSIKKMEGLIKGARIKPAICQVEAHPYWRNDAILEFCKHHGLHMTAYSPLGSPDSANMMKRAADSPVLMKDPKLAEIAAKLGRSPAQVLVRWALQRGTSVLAKSVNEERIRSNIDVLSWRIPEDDFKALSSLTTQCRMVDGSFLLDQRGPFRTLDELWDEPTPQTA